MMPFTSPRSVRYALLFVGWLSLAVGMVGAFLPLLPTTPFLLLSLWAFSRSSGRFHRWLLDHPLFGPTLRAWEEHRVIPPRAKIMAVCGMAGAMVWVGVFSAAPGYAVAAMGTVIAIGAWYVLSKPSRRPEAAGEAPPPSGHAISWRRSPEPEDQASSRRRS